MRKHRIRNALALTTLAALMASAVAFAEPDAALLAPEAVDEACAEVEVTLGPPEGEPAATPTPAPTPTPTATPKKLTLAAKKATLGAGERFALSPSGKYSGKLTFKSSKTSVATVNKKGVVTAKKVGKATIRAKLNGKTAAKCVVTVKRAPKTLKLNKGDVKLAVGKTLRLKAKLPGGAASHKITWKSSRKSVATVDAKGVVTAKKAGTTKITARTFNGVTATCVVTVKASAQPTQPVGPTEAPTAEPTAEPTAGPTEEPQGGTTCRALLIGEEGFSPACTRNRGDVTLMRDMLSSVRGPGGGDWSCGERYDLSRDGVLSAIRSAFADADDDDVSLFFIATHGDTKSDDRYAGALYMIPGGSDPLLLGDLADALQAVPGRVVVIIESCGSGAAVYVGDEEQNGDAAGMKSAARAFDRAVVDAFSGADTGVPVRPDAGGGAVARTGELRVSNKFYVLTASRYQELSWGTERGPYNFFTKWLTDGVGTSGRMPADKNGNGDGAATLDELFRYISAVGDNYAFQYQGGTYYQHVQVYPKSSDFELFSR